MAVTVIEQIVRLTVNGDETRAEVVGELIRCRDCKCGRAIGGEPPWTIECGGFYHDPDWYCGDGERKVAEDGVH